MSLYLMSNSEVISIMFRRLGLPGTIYDYVIDRKARTITSDRTGNTWPIPDDLNLA